MERDRKEALLHAAAAILDAAGGELGIVQLNKALFYLDLYALRDLGRTVSQATYIALDMGPVVAKYPQRLVAALAARGIAEQGTEGSKKPIRLLRLPRETVLTEEESAHATEIAKWTSSATASRLSEVSHQNPGWLVAYRTGRGAGEPPKPINMVLAMQQIADGDPWLDEDADDELLVAVNALEPSVAW